MQLAFKRWNPKNSTQRLLFLHGMGGTGSLWRPLAASLEEDFDILAPDQRGHGGSQQIKMTNRNKSHPSPTFTPLDSGQDLQETLEALQFHPCWVIGHSMGVRSACALAHLSPQWVQGLVLIDLGFSGPAGGGMGNELAQLLRNLPSRFENRAEAREFLNKECPDPSIAQYLLAVAALESPTASPGHSALIFPFDRSALIATIEAAKNTSVRTWLKELAELKKPILVLRGETSLVWSKQDFETERKFFQAYPHVQFEEFAGTGHGLPFEKRKEFVERLRRFTQSPTNSPS